jgi:hypothetical protein
MLEHDPVVVERAVRRLVVCKKKVQGVCEGVAHDCLPVVERLCHATGGLGDALNRGTGSESLTRSGEDPAYLGAEVRRVHCVYFGILELRRMVSGKLSKSKSK